MYDKNKWCLKCGQRGHDSNACRQRGVVGLTDLLAILAAAALLVGAGVVIYFSTRAYTHLISEGVSQGLEKAKVCVIKKEGSE